ncbi:hypothetical protein BP5796_12662 [Coleophoma crateriformis]|uniref:Uncharacterized protein n=1 Tax=Coleophoma crateriformis TaxID=565419 RepID=A0A3D8Q5X1_9HELO|nr:hypothetical protein BP5796_12662 [Coleophoma crateriformis]
MQRSQLREALAHSLGFPDYPANPMPEPYLNYIENRHMMNLGTVEAYLQLFRKVVDDFSQGNCAPVTLCAYTDAICNSREQIFEGTQDPIARRELVTDTILSIIGVWVTAGSYFVKSGGYRPVELAYCLQKGKSVSVDYSAAASYSTLSELLVGSGLVPTVSETAGIFGIATTAATTTTDFVTNKANIHALEYSRLDSFESLSVKSTTLNAYTLSLLSNTRISWTLNFSRHLLLTPLAGHHVLELYAVPCALRGRALARVGVPAALIDEIQMSYTILFNPYGRPSVHARYGKVLGLQMWCWCRSCSARRMKQRELNTLRKKSRSRSRRGGAMSEFDPLLVKLMEEQGTEDWSPDLFPYLWPRIVALEAHLHCAKPWNFWVLFADRRDTLQFWTFLFGSVILLLTVLQVGLGVAQVVGSF